MSQHTTPCRGPNAAQYAELKRNSHTYLADNTSPDETTGKRNTVATTEENANRTSRRVRVEVEERGTESRAGGSHPPTERSPRPPWRHWGQARERGLGVVAATHAALPLPTGP